VRAAVAERFGPAAVPEAVQRVPDLPYSRSGKLIRSVLRRVAVGETDGLEDLGLVTDPELLDALIHDRAAGGRKD
jgi:acetyl-CoA synthetase